MASPLYLAVIVCDPTANVVVVKLAEPLLTATACEIWVSPSKKNTVPVAAWGVILAINVNGVPKLKAVVLTESSSSTSVEALATVCTSGLEVEPLNTASPLYWAVMLWVPAPRLLVVKVAVPLVNGMLPEMATLPSKKTTVPVACAGATEAVKLNEFPNAEGLLPALNARVTTGVGFGEFTVSCNGVEIAALKVASPLYCAVME